MPFSALPTKRLPRPLASACDKILQIDRLEALYTRTKGARFTSKLLNDLQVDTTVSNCDLSRVPASGPVVAVSNHPHGILDGIILADLLSRIRPDVRVLTNGFLGDLPELQQVCFFINPFDRPGDRASNAAALRRALEHLKNGGLLAIFPSGEVSHFDLRKRAICDPQWTTTAVRLIRKTQARAVPISIRGANSLTFQMLGMVHPRLRTAALPAELMNKQGKSIEIRIGTAIEASRIASLQCDENATAYLRLRSELLGQRMAGTPGTAIAAQPVVASIDIAKMTAEIGALPAECLLGSARHLDVYLASALQVPQTLQEIGRLREITFRAAGEGSGDSVDLDRYDAHYLHLFVWNRERNEVVGAYRICDIPKVLAEHGSRGLYTKSLFRFHPGFFHRLGPALELGRSFVRPEYQRQFAPLLLLWKGIGAYVSRNPSYKTLIGPVSVSNQYSRASRELIAGYFERQKHEQTSGILRWLPPVWARHKLKVDLVQKWQRNTLCSLLPDVDDLSAPIADLEHDGKGLPILVKQYVRLGGKLLAFSVDPQFANTLDGFVLMDLTQTTPEILSRYMGKDKAAEFFAWHEAAAHNQAA